MLSQWLARAIRSSLTIGSSTRYFDRFGTGFEQRFSKKEINEVIGKASFDDAKLEENFLAFYNEILRLKPSTAKGVYMENVSVSSTMGAGVKVDIKAIVK